MNKIQRYQRTIKQLYLTYASQINSVYVRNYCTEVEPSKTTANVKDQNNSDKKVEASNFEQTFQSLNDIKIKNNMAVPRRNTFASLLRHSKFVDVNIKCFTLFHNYTNTFIAQVTNMYTHTRTHICYSISNF